MLVGGLYLAAPAAFWAGGGLHGFSEDGGELFFGGLCEDGAFCVSYAAAVHVLENVVADAGLVAVDGFDGGPVGLEEFGVGDGCAVGGALGDDLAVKKNRA